MKTFASAFALCTTLFLQPFCTTPAAAGSVDPEQDGKCLGGMVAIRAPSELEWSIGCAGSGAAIERLAECGITLKRPVAIFITEGLRTPSGSEAFGLFEPEWDLVSITALSALPRLAAGTPYEALSPPSLFKSVIVHETVHAVMEQNYSRKPSSRAAYEYPAYAVQMELLSAELGEASPNPLFESNGHFLLNDIILGFNPFLFAAHAHKHLRGDNDRCKSLRQSVDGDTAFIVALPY
jgi:hypothetical protein